jgi:phage N-6-adenine-methyltransferase
VEKIELKNVTDLAIKYHTNGIDKIKNGVKDWIACGECLLRIKDSLPHGSYIPYIESRLPFGKMQASMYVRFARQAPALLELIEKEGSMSQKDALKRLPAANKDEMAYVGSLEGENTGRDSDNWHTPQDIIEAAKSVMGGKIDLDPFSSKEANGRIGATIFYTEEDDALSMDWAKVETVFINPPYGRGVIVKAIKKVIEEYKKESFKEGVLLVNNATDTLWFHDVKDIASAVCFTKGRISFLSPAEDGVLKIVSGNTRGQVLFYFGKNIEAFKKEYRDLGWCFEVHKNE